MTDGFEAAQDVGAPRPAATKCLKPLLLRRLFRAMAGKSWSQINQDRETPEIREYD
jgi:hypothetical protein